VVLAARRPPAELAAGALRLPGKPRERYRRQLAARHPLMGLREEALLPRLMDKRPHACWRELEARGDDVVDPASVLPLERSVILHRHAQDKGLVNWGAPPPARVAARRKRCVDHQRPEKGLCLNTLGGIAVQVLGHAYRVVDRAEMVANREGPIEPSLCQPPAGTAPPRHPSHGDRGTLEW